MLICIISTFNGFRYISRSSILIVITSDPVVSTLYPCITSSSIPAARNWSVAEKRHFRHFLEGSTFVQRNNERIDNVGMIDYIDIFDTLFRDISYYDDFIL